MIFHSKLFVYQRVPCLIGFKIIHDQLHSQSSTASHWQTSYPAFFLWIHRDWLEINPCCVAYSCTIWRFHRDTPQFSSISNDGMFAFKHSNCGYHHFRKPPFSGRTIPPKNCEVMIQFIQIRKVGCLYHPHHIPQCLECLPYD